MEIEFSYAELADRYGDFQAPAVHIYLPDTGEEISGTEAGIMEMEVILSMDHAGSAVFTIAGGYDPEQSRFTDRVKEMFTGGTVIEISLGYYSEMRMVFRGIIAAVTVKFQETASVTCTAVDMRWLMAQNRRVRMYEGDTYSEIVKELMEAYEGICEVVIEETEEETTCMMQNGSDLQFIIEDIIRQGKVDRCFFVLGKTAYFIKEEGDDRPVVSLKRGEGLHTFVRRSVLAYKKVSLYSAESEDNPAESETGASIQGLLQLVHMEMATGSDRTGLIGEHAGILARRQTKQAQEAYGSCIGLPELVPGRCLAVSGLDPDYDQLYWLRNVIHKYDGDGYRTEFETRGWKHAD